MRDAFARARARREIRSDLDVDLALDIMTGPFYFRALFGHAPITRKMTRDIVDYVLRIAASPR
jgi:hypothetical protein